jgi:hypothetical protein
MFIQGCAAQVLPQPGNNLWHIAAALVTMSDELLPIITSDFAGTFTALAAIENATNSMVSKVDNLQSTVISDFNGTFTAMQTILNTQTMIQSKIEVTQIIVDQDFAGTFTALNQLSGCSCQQIPITIPSTGTSITTSGVYCLAADVLLSEGTISIAANDVVLDLNGHSITAPNLGFGITINGSGVTIQNGSLYNGSSAIITSGTNTDIIFNGLHIYNVSNNAINLSSVSNFLISNVKILQTISNGISLQSCNNGVVDNCYINQASSSQAGTGYAVGLSSGISVKNCIATGCAVGFQADNSYAIFENCTACENTNEFGAGCGFYILQGITTLRNCIASNNITGFCCINETSPSTNQYLLENCTAINNSIDGFYSNFENGTFYKCIAYVNGNNGFNISGSNNNTANHCLFKECIATKNGATGFLIAGDSINSITITGVTLTQCKSFFNVTGVDLSNNLVSDCTIELCGASLNTNGFVGNGLSFVTFYLNDAVKNGTSDYANLSPDSAPTNSLTSAARLYGDNLQT